MKSKPILLISIVGTLGLILLALNMTQLLRDPTRFNQRIEAPNQEALEKIRGRAQQASGPEGAQIGEMRKLAGMGTLGGGSANALLGKVPANPSIEMPSSKRYDEQFQANTTSALWYNDDSYQRVDAQTRKEVYEDPTAED